MTDDNKKDSGGTTTAEKTTGKDVLEGADASQATEDDRTSDADAKAVEEGIAAEQERARLASNTGAAAAAQTVAIQENQRKQLLENQAKLADVSNDTSTFEGQFVTTDNFAASTLLNGGAPVVEIRPNGLVGEGFRIPAARINEISKLLKQVKHLPDQE